MATRNDVAKLAGVSGATVTRVINGSTNVRQETRDKVMAAVHQLNYHTNYSGQILRGMSTRQILFYCPDLYNPFYVHVYYGMDDYAKKNNYNIVLTRHFDVETILQGRFDGVILSMTDYKYREHIAFLQKEKIPFICAAFIEGEFPFPTVSFDYHQAIFLAMDQLYSLNHRNVAYISDTSELMNTKWQEILKYQESKPDFKCQNIFLNLPPELNDNLFETGYMYASQIYRMIKFPTAVISANDALSGGLIRGLCECKIKLPDEMSIISFDDTYMSRFTVPSLTTIHFPKYEMGQTLVSGLLDILNNKAFHSVKLSSRLIMRESIAKAK